MANNGTIITAPVQMTDIQAVLGETKSDLIGICQSEKINPWAKYKPVIRRNMIEATSDYWKADDGMCGFAPSFETSSRDQLKNLLNADNRKWVYKPPQGGLNAPCRQGDFKNYNHNALNPFAAQLENRDILVSNQNTFTIEWEESLQGDDDMLNLSDFTKGGKALNQWYFGVMLSTTQDPTTGRRVYCTADTPNSPQVFFNTSETGVRYAVPFLSIRPFKVDSNASADDMFICIPQSKVAVLNLKKEPAGSVGGRSMSIGGEFITSTKLKVTIFFHNSSSASATFSNLTVYGNTKDTDTNQVYLGAISESVTVPANSSVTKEFLLSVSNQNFEWLKVYGKIGTAIIYSPWSAALDMGDVDPFLD